MNLRCRSIRNEIAQQERPGSQPGCFFICIQKLSFFVLNGQAARYTVCKHSMPWVEHKPSLGKQATSFPASAQSRSRQDHQHLLAAQLTTSRTYRSSGRETASALGGYTVLGESLEMR